MDKHHIELQSIKWRGKIIHETIILEKHIDLYIARYFCGSDEKKVKDLHRFFLGDNRTTFSGKCEVFKEIAEKYDKKWYSEFPSLKGNMFKDLLYFGQERNVVAHRLLDDSDEVLLTYNNSIVFSRYNMDHKYIVFDNNRLESLVLGIIKLRFYLTIRLFPEVL